MFLSRNVIGSLITCFVLCFAGCSGNNSGTQNDAALGLDYGIQQAVTGTAIFSDDFEDGNSTGWSTNGGSWSVVTDGTKVLKQSSTSATACAYTGTATWADYAVQATVKPVSFNGTDKTIALIARFQTTSNFYFVKLSNANTLSIQKRSGGNNSILSSKTYTVQTGSSYILTFVVNGSSLFAYVNDTLELSASDATFTTGKIGVYAVNASAEFDDVIVSDTTVVPSPSPSASASPSASPTADPSASPTATPTPIVGAIYISPSGSDSNSGTIDSPFYSLAKAVTYATSGSTIYARGGTYAYSTMVTLSQTGTSSAPIKIFAYPGEKPVFNYSTQAYASSNRAILLTGDYWYIKGIEICYAGDNAIKLEGSHNIIEFSSFHHNGDSGIQLGFAHETVNPNGTLCSYNQIINCDSYMNFDFDSKGGDADGFACKMHNGKGNVFTGCRSWRNSDDGWDLFETDWPVEITNCWTWHNGDKTLFDAIYLAKMGTKMSSFSGNGNGFKLGGNGTGGSSKGTHVVKNCVAFDCAYQSKKGFDQNSHKGGVTIFNCTAWGNGYNFMFEDNPDSGMYNTFKNNIAFAATGSLDHEFSSAAILQNNSWDLTVTANASDFASQSESLAIADRNSDGSLPNNNFAKLVSGSDLINKGVDVGISYLGSAPDLGAFEKE
jgi:pectate disaccharide-lyase